MTPELQSALIAEASRVGANPVDPDIFRTFPKITDDLDPEDSKAVAQAVKSMTEKSPALFHIREIMEPNH
jgi:hypothetical protein